jgi:hypothetical protein
LSFLALPCLVLFCFLLSWLVFSCLILFSLVLSYLVLCYIVLYSLILPYLALSCLISLFHIIWSCPLLSSVVLSVVLCRLLLACVLFFVLPSVYLPCVVVLPRRPVESCLSLCFVLPLSCLVIWMSLFLSLPFAAWERCRCLVLSYLAFLWRVLLLCLCVFSWCGLTFSSRLLNSEEFSGVVLHFLLVFWILKNFLVWSYIFLFCSCLNLSHLVFWLLNSEFWLRTADFELRTSDFGLQGSIENVRTRTW